MSVMYLVVSGGGVPTCDQHNNILYIIQNEEKYEKRHIVEVNCVILLITCLYVTHVHVVWAFKGRNATHYSIFYFVLLQV